MARVHFLHKEQCPTCLASTCFFESNSFHEARKVFPEGPPSYRPDHNLVAHNANEKLLNGIKSVCKIYEAPFQGHLNGLDHSD